MQITVKRLISELSKIENQFLEVEVCTYDRGYKYKEIQHLREKDKKLIIFTKES